MSNDRNTNAFWKNVATGVGVAAAGAALAYLVSELFTEEASHSQGRADEARRRRQSSETSSPQLRKIITDKLNSGTYDCNICLDEISRLDEIVSCNKCYTINHLRCIKDHYDSQSDIGRIPPDCPSCRVPITYDLEYYCFCGSTLNPPPIEGLTPHSCLSKCPNRKCRLRCHPGPCAED